MQIHRLFASEKLIGSFRPDTQLVLYKLFDNYLKQYWVVANFDEY